MTPKQTEKLKKKIADIRRILAAEKRRFGCYDDSRGLRYLPPAYFLQLGDYSGGLAYLKWFDKNFPDDGGFPEFLFESAILPTSTRLNIQKHLSILASNRISVTLVNGCGTLWRRKTSLAAATNTLISLAG